MAGPNYGLDKGFYPTAAVRQFRAVVADTTNKDKCTEVSVAGARILGISQNEAATGDANKRPIDIRVSGASRCIAGAAVSIADALVTDNQGRLVTATTGANQNQVGIAYTAATAAGDHIDVRLTPGVRITI